MPRFAPWMLSLALLLPWASDARDIEARESAAPAWRWQVAFDAELRHADVRLCMLGFGARLLQDHDDALHCTRVFPQANGQASFRSNPGRDGIIPLGLGNRGCLTYRVDLGSLLENNARTRRTGRDLTLLPGHLLLRPGNWPSRTRAEVAFLVPAGLDIAVPWGGARVRRLADGRTERNYTVHAGLVRTYAPMAIGRFETLRFSQNGAQFDVAVLDHPHRATRAGIERWLRDAARAQATLFGRFPVPHAALIVQPTRGWGDPVVFGRAFTGGGSTVRLQLSQQARDEELPGEWVGVHEMVHLGVPRLDATGQWLNEGFVTYYQEVLRARAGLRTPQQCWESLVDGFRRGAGSGGSRPLLEESRTMHRNHTYWRVYWGGAALALRLDVALRRQSQGRRSLDDVMRAMRERHRFPTRPWDAEALLAQVDRDLGTRLLAPGVAPHLRSNTFPPVAETLRSLGVLVEGRAVRLDDSAPLAAMRRAITSAPAPATQAR